MKEINLNDNDSKKSKMSEKAHDLETAFIERLPQPVAKKVEKATLLQRLTFVSFMMICFMIVILSIKVYKHNNTMSEYKLPEGVDASSIASIGSEEDNSDENVEYVDEVVYNPSKAAKKLTDEQNKNSGWCTLSCEYEWSFKSDFDYKSPKIDCLWVCSKPDGTVLAYHTGVYNGETDSFEEEQTTMTLQGMKNSAYEGGGSYKDEKKSKNKTKSNVPEADYL